MSIVLRCMDAFRGLWHIFILAFILAAALPPIVVAMPLVERELIDTVIVAGRIDLLPRMLALYAALWVLSLTCSVAGSVCITYLNERLANDFRQRLFGHSQKLSIAFSHQEHSGRTMSLFANDVPSLASGFGSSIFSGLGTIVTLLLAAWVMLSLNWQLALVAAILPPFIAVLAAIATRPLRKATQRIQEKAAELSSLIHENLAGLREIVVFGREHAQILHFSQMLHELLRLRMRATGMTTVASAGQGLFSLTMMLTIIGYGGYLVIQGQTTLGTLVAMRSLFSLVFQPATQMFGTIMAIQRSLGSADRVYAFLDRVPDVQERDGALSPGDVLGNVIFDQVSFSYPSSGLALTSISLAANVGEMIALVGPSGAGKTTLVSLVARLYDPSEGAIRLDGTDLRDLTLDGLRQQIAFVFQDTFLFATTIRDNIAFGFKGASEDEIVSAARAANAWEFIERLPDRLDTFVGERGAKLSEGQKQRLSIARALLRNPRILILDEPTSALDARSEHLLQTALERLMEDRTTFVIAHRLATVRRATQILVLDDGRIVQRGTHQELINTQGLYRELFELQFGSQIVAASSASS